MRVTTILISCYYRKFLLTSSFEFPYINRIISSFYILFNDICLAINFNCNSECFRSIFFCIFLMIIVSYIVIYYYIFIGRNFCLVVIVGTRVSNSNIHDINKITTNEIIDKIRNLYFLGKLFFILASFLCLINQYYS